MLGQFLRPSFNFQNEVTKSAAYTATKSDESINVTGDTTITLPSITALFQDGLGGKTYKITNTGTGTATITANSLDTIEDGSSDGASNVYIRTTDDYMLLRADLASKQWKVDYPNPQHDVGSYAKDDSIEGEKTSLSKYYGMAVDETNGTTAQNVFGSGGAPHGMTITGVFAADSDTNAGNIVVKNGTNTVCTIAKGTSAAGTLKAATTLANTSVTAADTCTVESSTTNGNAIVFIAFTSP